MTRSGLSQDDVVRLLTDPSGTARAAAAAKIAADFGQGGMGPAERKIAEEIFRLMVRDAEVRVREALAQNLKRSRDVPHEVILALAKDADSVAEPGTHSVLQASHVTAARFGIVHAGPPGRSESWLQGTAMPE